LTIDGYIRRGILQALNPLSNRVTFTAIVPEASRTGALNARDRKNLRFPTNIYKLVI